MQVRIDENTALTKKKPGSETVRRFLYSLRRPARNTLSVQLRSLRGRVLWWLQREWPRASTSEAYPGRRGGGGGGDSPLSGLCGHYSAKKKPPYRTMCPPCFKVSCWSTTTTTTTTYSGFYICLLLVILPAVFPSSPRWRDYLYTNKPFGVVVVVFFGWIPGRAFNTFLVPLE